MYMGHTIAKSLLQEQRRSSRVPHFLFPNHYLYPADTALRSASLDGSPGPPLDFSRCFSYFQLPPEGRAHTSILCK